MSVGNDTETTGCSHHICYYFYFGNRAEASVPAILIPRKGVTSSKLPIPWASTSGKCTGKGKARVKTNKVHGLGQAAKKGVKRALMGSVGQQQGLDQATTSTLQQAAISEFKKKKKTESND